MSVYRRYYFWKRTFQSVFAFNIFLAAWGVVALTQYWSNHDVSALQLVFVGSLTFLIGIVAPLYAIWRLDQNMKELRKEFEQKAIELFGLWLQSTKESDESYSQPMVWLNLALLAVEVLLKDTSHPAGSFIQEMSPLIRAQIRKAKEPTGHMRKARAV